MHRCTLVRAGRNSIWLFVVNFNIGFSIGQRVRDGRYKIPHLQQYLSVMCNQINHLKFAALNLEIINTPLKLDIYGFSGIAVNNDYAGTAFKLMDKMWQIVKSKKIKNKGLNI